MKIFIAICNDRHCDTTAHPFSDREKAIDWARREAKDLCRHEEDYEEIEGIFEFYAIFSCEGDCIYVAESELDGIDK